MPRKYPFPKINYGNGLAKNLIVDWHLNEGAGTIVYSAATRYQTLTMGTMNTAATWTKDLFGVGLKFDGTTGACSMPTNGTVNLYQNYALECWLKTAGTNSSEMLPMQTSNVSDSAGASIDINNNQWTILINGKNRTGVGAANNVVGTTLYHVIMTGRNDAASGTPTQFWVNARLIGTIGNNVPNTPTTTFQIGAGRIGVGTSLFRFFNGIVYSARIWDRWLNAREIGKLYANPYALYTPISFFNDSIHVFSQGAAASAAIQQNYYRTLMGVGF